MMLRERMLAAVLGLPIIVVMLGLNWYLRVVFKQGDDVPQLLLMLFIAAACGYEASALVRRRLPRTAQWHGAYAAVLLPLIVYQIRDALPWCAHPEVGSLGLLLGSVGATAATMMLFLGVWSDVEHRGKEGVQENVAVLGMGLYIGVGCTATMLIGETAYREAAAGTFFLLVFSLDTAAYFGGMLGGPKLAPTLSPGKKWSGAIVGFVAVVAIALLALLTAGWTKPAVQPPSALWMVAFAVAVGVFGQVGDLLESGAKRWAGAKDSGNILPGHGGFLDRFDSLLLAAPVCYVLLAALLGR